MYNQERVIMARVRSLESSLGNPFDKIMLNVNCFEKNLFKRFAQNYKISYLSF